MPATFDIDQFTGLPLFAQALIAQRLVRRAALAVVADLAPTEREFVLGCCDTIERCAAAGQGTQELEAVQRRVDSLSGKAGAATRPLFHGLYFAIDAARAAEAASDFPIDATVTNSARKAIAAIAEDRRLSPLQLTILLAGDLDQIRFTTGEARIGKYDGLTNYVFERITPTHALTLNPAPISVEEQYR